MPNSDLQFLITFVLDQAAQAPIKSRARIYRALAEVSGVPDEIKRLNELARDLEGIEAREREFAFQISQRSQP